MKKRDFSFRNILVTALGNIYGTTYKPPKGFGLINVDPMRSLYDDEKAIHAAKLKRERKNALRSRNFARCSVRNPCIRSAQATTTQN